ncbi:hypothetical protein ABTY63_27065 [Streptomyces solisilvae]|uniref:hypothetical protein n=1 Tax=Streptomyces malaysiensis TaxID=92644 RepID=UPI003331B3B7
MAPAHKTRAALASLIGGSIEHYQFFVYGLSASLVFGNPFFPFFGALAGTLLSLSTFGIAFLTRPLGGWTSSHFGDRIGSKKVTIATLVGMGGTAVVGLVTTVLPRVRGEDVADSATSRVLPEGAV